MEKARENSIGCEDVGPGMELGGSSVGQAFSQVKWVWGLRHEMRKLPGQGTTEYAILVGVLVVIAILAITLFRPKIQELWDAITSGINGL